jgi:CRP-like cAMP-binding protein
MAIGQHYLPTEPQHVPEHWLKEIPLFTPLPPDTLTELGGMLTIETYQPGQKIFSYGDPGDRLFFICRGKVTFTLTDNLGHTETFGVVENGGCAGEVAVFGGGTRTADGQVTDEELVTLELRREDIDRFLEICPEARRMFLELMARRLEAASHRARHGMDRFTQSIEKRRTPSDRRLARIVNIIANPWFLAVQVIGSIAWGIWNRKENSLDPFPYAFLSLVFGVEAFIITLIILSYQNREEQDARIRDAAQDRAADEVNRRLDELLKRIPPTNSG